MFRERTVCLNLIISASASVSSLRPKMLNWLLLYTTLGIVTCTTIVSINDLNMIIYLIPQYFTLSKHMTDLTILPSRCDHILKLLLPILLVHITFTRQLDTVFSKQLAAILTAKELGFVVFSRILILVRVRRVGVWIGGLGFRVESHGVLEVLVLLLALESYGLLDKIIFFIHEALEQLVELTLHVTDVATTLDSRELLAVAAETVVLIHLVVLPIPCIRAVLVAI